MSVKKKDRHISMNEPLGKSRILMHQLLIITHPAEYNKDGKRVWKPGLLGEGQPFQAFGIDIFNCGKRIHGACYQAGQIHLKDRETLDQRTKHHQDALNYCDSILRQLDLCIFDYASKNKKKRKSFMYVAKLTLDVKHSVQDRMNRDKLIYEHKYVAPPHAYRRGR